MNNNLHERAIEAATRFIERHDYAVLASSWKNPIEECEGRIDLIAKDGGTLVFIDATAKTETCEGFDYGHTPIGELEILAAEWLALNEPEADCPVRFDCIDMIVFSANRVLLRYHINARPDIAQTSCDIHRGKAQAKRLGLLAARSKQAFAAPRPAQSGAGEVPLRHGCSAVAERFCGGHLLGLGPRFRSAKAPLRLRPMHPGAHRAPPRSRGSACDRSRVIKV